ncbi:MAG TPA: AsmA family protein [Rhodocyclaceae bacterium]|nr:AsmA family protein [Rhodocyclaceae bacterium]
MAPVPAPAPPPPSPGFGEKVASGVGGLGERIRIIFSRDASRNEGPDLKPVRKIRMGALLTGLIAGLLLLGGVVVFLFPYNAYRPDIERALAASWGVPVRVKEVQARFLPRPGLLLSGVEFGSDGDARFGEVLIPQLLSLGSGDRTIRDLVISNAVVKADFLAKLDAAGKNMVGGVGGFQVRHATLHNLSIVVGELHLRPYNGEAVFGKSGLEKISLENEERTLRFDLIPRAGGADLSAQGFAWKPGAEESAILFASIQARGLVQAGKVTLSEVDANVLNGNVVGNLSLDWTQGLKMAGELQLTRLSARQISQTFKTGADVDGDVSGMMRYAGAGTQLSELWKSLDATLAMTMTRGAVNGVDLGEAARRGGGKSVGGGSTRFDRLNCTLRITPQYVSCPDIDLDAGLMSATGQFLARPDKSVDATLQVQIKSSVMPIRATTRVTGTLPMLQTAASGK